jgi:hypothetical protein
MHTVHSYLDAATAWIYSCWNYSAKNATLTMEDQTSFIDDEPHFKVHRCLGENANLRHASQWEWGEQWQCCRVYQQFNWMDSKTLACFTTEAPASLLLAFFCHLFTFSSLKSCYTFSNHLSLPISGLLSKVFSPILVWSIQISWCKQLLLISATISKVSYNSLMSWSVPVSHIPSSVTGTHIFLKIFFPNC